LVRAARDAAEKALHELQTAQASLVHAQKMAALGQVTAGIAHEIKNPLNFVNNFAGLSVELLDELKDAAVRSRRQAYDQLGLLKEGVCAFKSCEKGVDLVESPAANHRPGRMSFGNS
jgi:signal transduction histidine kinase